MGKLRKLSSLTTNPAITKARLAEVLDPTKVTLICELHQYVAGAKTGQVSGCKQCILVDFIYKFAKTKPEKRAEALDQFEALVQTMCELEDEGKLDIHIYPTAEVQIEKDAI